MMVEQGCLQVLIQLSNQPFERLMSSNTLYTATPSETRLIRFNCAAALRLLTYNKDLRGLLVESEAINIILAEIRKESDINMSQSLLKELEAESWENGARTKQKEGRIKGVTPAALFTNFLKGNAKVELDFEAKDVELEKYYVEVHLEEDVSRNQFKSTAALNASPSRSLEDKEQKISVVKRSNSFRRTKLAKMLTQATLDVSSTKSQDMMGIEPLRIDDLMPRDDADDVLALIPQAYGKAECEIDVDASFALLQVTSADEVAEDDTVITNDLNVTASGSKGKSPPTGSESNPSGSRGKKGCIPDIIYMRNDNSSSNSRTSASSTRDKRIGHAKSISEFPAITTPKPKTIQKPSEKEEINHLLQLINKARFIQDDGAQVGELLDKWKAISRF
jgi:hypothetical protein